MRTFKAKALGRDLACLVLEQVNRVACVVPEQVIGPAARLALGVHVGAAKKICLHVHLLDLQFARVDPAADPLVRRVEAAHLPGHRQDARLLLYTANRFTVGKRIRHRNLDQHRLARFHAGNGLFGVHLRWRRQDDRIDVFVRDAGFKRGRGKSNAALCSQGIDLGLGGAHHGRDSHVVDVGNRIQVLCSKGAIGTRDANPHFDTPKSFLFARMT